MSKTKIFAFSALLAMLFSCGSQDGGPPELTKTTIGPISPFDILKVEFNSEIIELDTSSIIGDATLIPSNSKKELHFVGKNTTPGGFLHFLDGLPNEPIILKKLKNSDGYVKDSTTVYFSTYRILDIEPNSVKEAAKDISSENEVKRSIPFAGIIDKTTVQTPDGEVSETRDFYKLDLAYDNVISITVLNGNDSISVNFQGDCLNNTNGCNNKTVKSAKTTVLQDTIKRGHFNDNATFVTTAPFYIEISDRDLTKPANPYLITIKVEPKR